MFTSVIFRQGNMSHGAKGWCASMLNIFLLIPECPKNHGKSHGRRCYKIKNSHPNRDGTDWYSYNRWCPFRNGADAYPAEFNTVAEKEDLARAIAGMSDYQLLNDRKSLCAVIEFFVPNLILANLSLILFLSIPPFS